MTKKILSHRAAFTGGAAKFIFMWLLVAPAVFAQTTPPPIKEPDQKSEPAKSEPAKSEPTKSEPAKVEPTKIAMPAVAVSQPAATSEAIAQPKSQILNLKSEGSNPPAGSTLDELQKLKAADKLTEARAKALEALKTAGGDEKKSIEDFLSEIAAPLIFSKRPLPEKTEYSVVTGDSLALLAKKFGTTVDVIRKGNNLAGQTVRLGSRLRIFNGKLSIVVNKSQNTLTLLVNDQFLKRYRVGTGQYSTTPTGTFKITGKVAQPTWYRPDGKSIPYGDKENLLGTYWMSIDVPGFGIHGTWEPDTIGKQSSQGCVRLLNSDIEELFTIVPEGTPVIIQD